MQAIIFPGQGSQYLGMGKSLYDNFSEAKDVFSSINSILGFKLSEKCFSQTGDLTDTSVQQLAILAVSLAAFEVFKLKSIEVSYLCGLSLGEYSCLYAAGVLSLEEVVILVKERALAMQKAAFSNPSTMLAVIGLERKVLEEGAAKEDFHIANINSLKQTVVSLSKDNKAKVAEFLTGLGGRVVELEVSGGFHSPFMLQAKEDLAKVIKKMNFCEAKIPIVSNFTARAHTDGQEIQDNLLSQLIFSVLWKDCMEFIIAKGADLFFEIGPSKVLRGLMRKIDPEIKVVNIEKKEDLYSI